MIQDLQLPAGGRALDIGCGRGRVANHVARVSNASVVGINIDVTQLENARKYARATGMQKQLTFQTWDVNNLPFPFENESLDGVYHVQVFSLSQDLLKLFKEIYRILKPGSRLSCLDWVLLDNYNPNNAEHVDLLRRIKPLIGKQFKHLLKSCGLRVL